MCDINKGTFVVNCFTYTLDVQGRVTQQGVPFLTQLNFLVGGVVGTPVFTPATASPPRV
ncbi:hypothetical protein MKW98_027482, partial [Papaver atlanticum]